MSRLPEWVWAPLSAALLSLVIGATGLWAGMPWLFPSLGPTIFPLVHEPDQDSARPCHVVVGHALGIVAAAFAVWVTTAKLAAPVLSSDHMTWPRVWASVTAMGEHSSSGHR